MDAYITPLVRQRARTYLDMVDRTDPGFRKLGQIRTVSRPHTTPLPARIWVIDSRIEAARIKRQWIGNPEHGERFFLRIENEHRIRSRSRDDHRILAKPGRIELINPQEVRKLGASCFLARALEFQSWQFPVSEFSSLGIQAPEVTTARRKPYIAVRTEIDAVRKAPRSRQPSSRRSCRPGSSPFQLRWILRAASPRIN